MEGRLFRFSEADKNLLAFVSLNKKHEVCKNGLLLVPGLTDGFMSMNYTQHLSEELLKIDFSMVQVNLSTSFNQFGFNSLKTDCSELAQLVKKMKEEFHFQKIVFLGHSTGAQGALYFVRHSEASSMIDAVILQAGVSDRDDLLVQENTTRMLDEAKKLQQEGKEDAFLAVRSEGAPVTAARFLSLAGRLTDDDMFSVDLSENEIEPILCPVKVPISLCFSQDDQYVPDKAAQKVFAERMMTVLKRTSPKVDCKYFPGDHSLTEPVCYQPFVEYVCDFVCTLVDQEA